MFVITESGVLADLAGGAEVRPDNCFVRLYRLDCKPIELCQTPGKEDSKRIVRELGRCIAEGLLCVEMEEVVRRAKEREVQNALEPYRNQSVEIIQDAYYKGHRTLQVGDKVYSIWDGIWEGAISAIADILASGGTYEVE